MQKLIAKVNEYSTAMILDAVVAIGGGQVGEDKRMVRAALIEVYMQREGEDAADMLMTHLGMM
jgi:hypothetical protein